MTGKSQDHAAHHLTATAAVVFVACAVCSLTLAPGSPALATMEGATLIAAVVAYALYAADASPRAEHLAGLIDERSRRFLRTLSVSLVLAVLLAPPRSNAELAERIFVGLAMAAVAALVRAARRCRAVEVTDSTDVMVHAITSALQRPYDQDVDR